MRLSQRYHHDAIRLSLLAVLMLYMGPLYSQLTRPMPMHGVMVMSSQTTQQHHVQSHSAQHQTPLSHLEACGYCSLLFHLSWLQALAVPLVTTQVPSLPLPTVRRASAEEADVYSPAYPRAPPDAGE